MSGAPISTQNLRIDALAVVANTQSKLPPVIADFQFDASRACMAECIAQRFASDTVDFVAATASRRSRRTSGTHFGEWSKIAMHRLWRNQMLAGQFVERFSDSLRQIKRH